MNLLKWLRKALRTPAEDAPERPPEPKRNLNRSLGIHSTRARRNLSRFRGGRYNPAQRKGNKGR